MELSEIELKRVFSTCFYKRLKLSLGEFDLSKDFTGECSGDKYPLLYSLGQYEEHVKNGVYSFRGEEGAAAARLITPLFPYASYEITVDELCGECGFSFNKNRNHAGILLCSGTENTVCVKCISDGSTVCENTDIPFKSGMRFSLTIRPGKADAYIRIGDRFVFVTSFAVSLLDGIAGEDVFRNIPVCVYFSGSVSISGATVFMDSGISQADIRPVCYENGEVITENGKIYLTCSIRQHEGAYQGVFSWVPGTCEFALTGALFFDTGDGERCNDVASDLIYNRKSGKWLIWVCSFSHGHVLARAELEGDVRHGVSVIDVKLVEPLKPGDTDEAFGGKAGDEDPALIYDESRKKWILAVCRISCENKSYRYHFFESDSPLDGFEYVGKGVTGCETGGSFVRYGEKLYFVCGNSFQLTSDYRVYDFDDLSSFGSLRFDYPDGGFRGWGSIMPITKGTRQRLYMLTFDRHRGSDYNWSYGNVYCFSN